MANIILDVDGTLWDSTAEVAVSWNEALQAFPKVQRRVTGEELKGLFGRPTSEIFEMVFTELSEQERERAEKACTENEHKHMNTAPCVVFDGVKEGLEKLSEEHSLFIVSNCLSGYIEAFLRNTGLSPYISDHLCFGDTGRAKGENILQIMRENELTSAVYVGDTAGDCTASKAANVPFVFASYGFGNVEKADVVIEEFGDLLKIDYENLTRPQ